MSHRSIRRHVGQLILAGFDGPELPDELRAIAREFDLGGVILFARNVEDPQQVADLSRDVGELPVELPAWMAVDQEGGRVARLREPFTRWPPMRTLGRSADVALAARFAAALAAELAAVGVTLDFAPVLDVLTNPANPAIGDRALADEAHAVARLGRTIITTLQAEGVAACGKHFPGHGDTSVDSHEDMPVVEHGLDRLRAVELEPFRAAIDAGVAAIMTAHVLVPALDEERPATLAPRIVGGLLRDELAFDGVVFTDDLDMGALTRRYGVGETVIGAAAAGCDGLLLCGPDHARQVEALEALIHAVEEGTLAVSDVERSMRRHRRMKERFLAPGGDRRRAADLATIGADAHRAVAEEMARFL